MLVTQCPRCQESVRVPESLCDNRDSSEFDSDVQVQCPWCQSTLTSAEIKAAIPPSLVVLSAGAELQSVGASAEAWNAEAETSAVPRSRETTAPSGSIQHDFAANDQVSFDSELALDPIGSLDEVEELAPAVGIEPIQVAPPESDDEELGEFQVPQMDATGESRDKVAPVMMDIHSSKRRRRSGPNLKMMAGVAVGSLLSLPIVGGILHVMGKPVPVIGDLLNEYVPMGNQTVTTRASQPMVFESQDVEDDEPVTGRSLANELSPEELMSDAVAPMESAMAAITGDDPVATANVDTTTPDSLMPESEPPALIMPESNILPEPMVDADPIGISAEVPAMDLPGVVFGSTVPVDEPERAPSPDAPAPVTPSTDTRASEPEIAPSPANDIANQVTRLQQTLADISSMPTSDPGHAAAVEGLYEGLSTVAGNVNAESIEQARPLVQSVASNMSMVMAFAKASPGWIKKTAEERETDGVLVVGKLPGGTSNPRMQLTGGEYIAVKLPANTPEVPAGIQIGLGKIVGEGNSKSISLDMLQGLQP